MARALAIFIAFLQIPFYFLLEIFYFITRTRPRKQIKNQHVLVTGSAEGIGAQFALQFAEMGNTVHCLDINGELNEKMVEGLKAAGYNVYAYTCDLRKWEELEAVYNMITEKGFVITYLVNNAGIAFGRGLTSLTFTQLQASIQINLIAQLWTIKLFLPKMKELNEGHIVNIASIAGLVPLARSTDYCAAKAGSVHLANQLRFEHVETNIKFSVVCPFWVATRIITGIEEDLTSQGITLLTPKQLVENAMVGIQENRDLIVVPKIIGYIITAMSLLPSCVKEVYVRETQPKDTLKPEASFVGQRMTEKIK